MLLALVRLSQRYKKSAMLIETTTRSGMNSLCTRVIIAPPLSVSRDQWPYSSAASVDDAWTHDPRNTTKNQLHYIAPPGAIEALRR